ncbi:MAG: hypothetical protein R3B68_13380 [Phycisphaerales bacterium]
MSTPTPAQPYRILASPGVRTITVGSRVRYTLVGGPGGTGQKAAYDEIFWFWQAERDFDDRLVLNAHKSRSTQTFGNHNTLDIDYLKPYADTDLVVWAAVRNGTQVTAVEPVRQRVDEIEVALDREVDAARDALPNPWLIRAAALKYAKVLRLVAQFAPPPSVEAFEEHHRRLRRLDMLGVKLAELFEGHFYLRIHKLNAVYIEKQSQETKRLRVALVKTGEKGGDSTWALIDWTDPNDERLHGKYAASGPSDAVAIERAIDAWNKKSKYPPGHIRYVIPQEISRGIEKPRDGFEVGERGFWGTVADFLGAIATAAAVVAAVVTVMIPVPGSQLVSAALWTSVFASSAAAVINITTQDRGWKEDALDGLTIVGNLFTAVGAGARLWSRGGTISVREKGGKVVRYALIGQITADSINAVVTSYEIIVDFDKIMSDPNLSPSERVQRLLQILGRGTMQAVSIRGTKEDLKNLTLPDGSGIKGFDRLQSLKDPKADVDLTAQPKAAGSTQKPGGNTTHVQVDHRKPTRGGHGSNPPPRPKTKRAWPKPGVANSRGMRGIDNVILGQVAEKRKLFIVVRDGNPDGIKYMGRKGDFDKYGSPITYEGKPESMKAKTAKEGPYKGLVCFDPSHARTHETLARMAGMPEISVDQLLGGRSVKHLMEDTASEFYRRYHTFRNEKIDAAGYRVIDDDNFIVVHADTGVRYHGDYDLHGVHHADGKHMDDVTAVANELNQKMQAKMIQHGAHSGWPDRNNPKIAGENAGPMPPVTIYTPTGDVVSIAGGTMADMRKRMKQFYQENNMTWRYEEWEALPGNKIDTDE